MALVVGLRKRALHDLRQLRARLSEDAKAVLGAEAAGAGSGAFVPVPAYVHSATLAVNAALAAGAVLVSARPECSPWILREPLLMLLHGWSALQQGYLHVLWWGVQYNVFGNVADHPKRPAEADTAYIASLLEQTDVLLEADVVSARADIAEYLSESVRPEVASTGAAEDAVVAGDAALDRRLRPAASAGCSDDGHELLRRDLLELWTTDHGLLGQFLREVLLHQPPRLDGPSATVADVCAGGGHNAAALNVSGLVLATAFGSSPTAPKLTAGRVQHLDIAQAHKRGGAGGPLADWVLCLEAEGKVSPGQEEQLLQNLAASARVGVVLTWDVPDACRRGGPSPRASAEALISGVGLQVDTEATGRLRAQAETPSVQQGVLLLRRLGVTTEPAAHVRQVPPCDADAPRGKGSLPFTMPTTLSSPALDPGVLYDARRDLERVLTGMVVPKVVLRL